MSDDSEIAVKVSADASGVKDGMQEAADAVKEGLSAMREGFSGFGEAIEGVMGKLTAFAGLLAGGAFFREGINATKEMTEQAVNMSRSLGVSTEDASTLNVALKRIGSSADVYTQANAKLTRQVRTNEAAVNEMGVKTRGANGALLDGKTIMTNAIEALKGYKEGTDRNLAGMELFGRGAQEVSNLLKLNNEIMDQSKKSAEALGLVIGPEQAARTEAYIVAMAGVSDVLEGIENTIGQAVMPILTEMAEWFNSIGPTVVNAFRIAMQAMANVFGLVIDVAKELWSDLSDVFHSLGVLITQVTGVDIPGGMQIWKNAMILVETAALGLKEGVVLAFEIIRAGILIVISELQRFADVANAAFHLDWAGVESAVDSGTRRVEKILQESRDRIMAKTVETSEQMQRVLMGGEMTPKKPTEGGNEVPTGTKDYHSPKAGKGNGEEMKAEFAVMRATLEGELAVQKEYLKESEEAYTNAYKNNKISLQEYYADKLATEEAGLAASINIQKEEIKQTQALEAQATKPSDKLGLKAQEIKLTAQLTVLLAQQADAVKKNDREMTDADNARINSLQEIARLSTQQAGKSGVDMDKINAEKSLALKQITNDQMLQLQIGFENRMYAIDLKANQDRIALANNDPKVLAQINAEKEQIEKQHQAAMADIDKDIAVESGKNMIAAQDAIESSFSGNLAKMLDGTEKLRAGFKSLFDSIIDQLATLAAKQMTATIFGSLTGAVGGGANGNNAGWLGGIVNALSGSGSSGLAGAIGGSGGSSSGSWLGSLLGLAKAGSSSVIPTAGADSVDGMGDALSAIASYDVGTAYVPQDGLAMIHKGERVITAKDNASGNYGGSGGGMNVFNFQTPTVPDRRSQAQIASAAAAGAAQAQRRNS